MNDLGLKYGFLTTYEDTVFLRQVIHNRLGVLEYSPVIHHSNTFSEADGTVTLRQCSFHVALLALEDAAFQDMNQRSQKWTR